MKILKMKDNKNGSATMNYELTAFELKVIKRSLGVKRLTRKRINAFIMKSIIMGTNKGVNK